jgi:hypothetical protein
MNTTECALGVVDAERAYWSLVGLGVVASHGASRIASMNGDRVTLKWVRLSVLYLSPAPPPGPFLYKSIRLEVQGGGRNCLSRDDA